MGSFAGAISFSGAIGVAWGTPGLASLATQGVGEAPGGVEGGPVVDLHGWVYARGACRVCVMVGRKEQKQK